MKTTTLKIDGMSCDACVASARQALKSVAGVRSADVDLTRGTASVEHGDAVKADALVAAVTDIGYDAREEGT